MKSIFLVLITLFLCLQGMSQKIYATKSGQITFNATGTAEKIIAVNNQVDSKFVETTGQIIFGALVKAFKFENQLMEDHFNENYMESTGFPKADFKGYITNIKEVNFTKAGNYPIEVEGNLTIHGVSNKIKVKGALVVEGEHPTIKGEFTVPVKAYGIKGSYIGDKIAGEASIKLNCKY